MPRIGNGTDSVAYHRPHRTAPHPHLIPGHNASRSPQRHRHNGGPGAQRQPGRSRPEGGLPPRGHPSPLGEHPHRPPGPQMPHRRPQSPQRNPSLPRQGNGPEGGQSPIQGAALPPQLVQGQKAHRAAQGQTRHERIREGEVVDDGHHRPPGREAPPFHGQRQHRRGRPGRRPSAAPQRPPPPPEARYRSQGRRTTRPGSTGDADGCEVEQPPPGCAPPTAPPGRA